MTASSIETVCVLGGGGFLGSHLVRALLERGGFTVLAVDRRTDRLRIEDARLAVRCADLAAPGLIEEIVDAADLVVSCTALCNPALYNTRPVEVIEGSYDHLVPLVDRCAEQGRWLVHFSTCEVYGANDGAPMSERETPLALGPVQRERWSYACAKQLLERRIWARGKHNGLPFVIVRPFNVIGPWMDYLSGIDGEGTPRVLACFMRALLFDEPLLLVDGGGQRRSFMHVDEFIDGVVAIIERIESCRGEIINLGHPENDVSIAELAGMLLELADERGLRHRAGMRQVTAEEMYGEGYDDIAARVPDITRARELLGWRPRISLAEMLPGILDDYVTRYSDRAASGAERG